MGWISLAPIFLVIALWIPPATPICYDQSPFWFLTRPVVENLLDDEGRILSNKVRVKWGALHNFKCVDYFQVEYHQKDDPENTQIMTPRIDRFRRYYDIDVDPCTKYVVKVQASEDYQGRREDFKAVSLEVHHKVDYTPRFMSKPSVKELKIRKGTGRGRGRRSKRELDEERDVEDYNVDEGDFGFVEVEDDSEGERARRAALLDWDGDYSHFQRDEAEEETTEPPPDPVNIRVSWRLSQIDYPTCLDYFVLDYYDITYNESTYSRTLGRPFAPQLQIDINSDAVPCDPEFRYILRVFGLTGDETRVAWTPPSCIFTTPAPTTTLEPDERADVAEYDMYNIMEENDQLRAKIEGLNEEYAKIGVEVFKAFSDDIFGRIEILMAERHERRMNESSWG